MSQAAQQNITRRSSARSAVAGTAATEFGLGTNASPTLAAASLDAELFRLAAEIVAANEKLEEVYALDEAGMIDHDAVQAGIDEAYGVFIRLEDTFFGIEPQTVAGLAEQARILKLRCYGNGLAELPSDTAYPDEVYTRAVLLRLVGLAPASV